MPTEQPTLDPARVAEAQAVICQAVAEIRDRMRAAGLEMGWDKFRASFVVNETEPRRPWHAGFNWTDTFPEALAECDRLIAAHAAVRDTERAKHPTPAEQAAMLGIPWPPRQAGQADAVPA